MHVPSGDSVSKRLLIIVNVPAFFVSHRLPIAVAARREGYEVHVATATGPGVDAILAAGLTHHALPLTRTGTRPIGELRLLLAMSQLMRRVRPDVLHLVTIKPVLYGGIIARILGVPAVVAAVSGLGFVFLDRGLRASIFRLIVGALYGFAFRKRELRVIFQNPEDRDRLTRATGLARYKSVLIPGSGVDLNEYRDTPSGPKNAVPVVVMAARLVREKGVYEFVAAARALQRRGTRARFLLVGESDADSPSRVTEAELAGWRAEGAVEALGKRHDIPLIFAAADIVVLPSYREGLPRVLAEAAACGRAVVTTDVPGCRDAIVPDVTGLLVPPRDPDALAQAFERLLADRPLRERMGRAGRKLAESRFSIDSVVSQHLAVYRELYGAAV